MSLLVDPARWPHRGGLWCHLVSDASFEELHEFAHRLGIPRVAFQGDHYDLDEKTRQSAVQLGARTVDPRVIVSVLGAAGLRRGPALVRRGLAGVRDLPAPQRRTDRLLLRQWRDDDREAFAAMNADPAVARWLGGPLRRDQSDALVDRHAVLLAVRGFGLWSVERSDTGEFVGAVGLNGVGSEFSFGPALEVAWRLAPGHQGRGFATEAAREALTYAASVLEVSRVAAFTSVHNDASLSVMDRLGMRADDRFGGAMFDHPNLDLGHPLRRHALRWWTPT